MYPQTRTIQFYSQFTPADATRLDGEVVWCEPAIRWTVLAAYRYGTSSVCAVLTMFVVAVCRTNTQRCDDSLSLSLCLSQD